MRGIQPFFEWCQQTGVYAYITGHEFAFPALELVHIFGLTLLLGSVLILSLRLMRLLLTAQPVSDLANEMSHLLRWGLWLTLVSGVFLFIATAIRNYGNTSFWVKMAMLVLALVFHVAYFRRVVRRDDERAEGSRKLAGAMALVLWFGVAVAGRSIGFFG